MKHLIWSALLAVIAVVAFPAAADTLYVEGATDQQYESPAPVTALYVTEHLSGHTAQAMPCDYRAQSYDETLSGQHSSYSYALPVTSDQVAQEVDPADNAV